MTSTTRTEFNDLSVAARQALAMALRVEGDASPVVIFIPDGTWVGVLGRVAGTLLGLILLSMAVGSAFGPGKAGSTDPLGVFLPAALSAAMLSDTALRVWRRHLGKRWPFRRGTYLLPWHLVDARTSRLVLHSLEGLKSVNLTHQHYNFIYSHTKVRLTLKDGRTADLQIDGKQKSQDAMARSQALQQRYAQAVQAKDHATAERLDPLWSTRLPAQPPQQGTAGPTVPKDPTPVRLHGVTVLGTGLAVGAVLGGIAWLRF